MSASPSATFVHKTLPNYKSEKWLQKYGWERGHGLGKDQQGRLDFIKASKKDNTKGLGTVSYQVKDFSHWDDIYTKASQSLKIEEGASGEVEITAEEKKEETKKAIYSGMFVTGGTMADERKAEKRKEKIKSEDDLFRRCAEADGRGARQAGKHSRLDAHDEELKHDVLAHNQKRIDSIYKDMTEAEKKTLDKAERKQAKKEREKKKEANKKSAERKKKRKREAEQSDSESDSEEEKKAKTRTKKSKKQE